ncbi:hypothetical protein PRO82_000937 [Candidatus Protochlamydia amoebophila]|nr:hypothetical protein [Candidatus Protochlamydia amoebophila]
MNKNASFLPTKFFEKNYTRLKVFKQVFKKWGGYYSIG